MRPDDGCVHKSLYCRVLWQGPVGAAARGPGVDNGDANRAELFDLGSVGVEQVVERGLGGAICAPESAGRCANAAGKAENTAGWLIFVLE